jgi:hypothetical protein
MEMVASRGSDNKDRGGDFFLGFSWSKKEECGEKSHQRGFDVATQQCINRLFEVWKDYNWSWDKELLERVFFQSCLKTKIRSGFWELLEML